MFGVKGVIEGQDSELSVIFIAPKGRLGQGRLGQGGDRDGWVGGWVGFWDWLG